MMIRRKIKTGAVPLIYGGPNDDQAVAEAFEAVSMAHPEASAKLSALHLQAQCHLLERASRLCVQDIEQDVRIAARVQNAEARDRDKRVAKLLDDRVRVARHYVVQHAETRAIRHYVLGLLSATSVSFALLLSFGLAGPFVWRSVFGVMSAEGIASLHQGLVAVGGGVAGAVVSVLVRSNRGIGEADDESLIRAARIRVALGWFFGAVVVSLIKGQVIDVVKTPDVTDTTTLWFFWFGLGFLAGFNERWVRQLISRGAEKE